MEKDGQNIGDSLENSSKTLSEVDGSLENRTAASDGGINAEKGFQAKQRMLMNRHSEILQDLRTEYPRILDKEVEELEEMQPEYEDVIEKQNREIKELREDYEQLLEDHEEILEELMIKSQWFAGEQGDLMKKRKEVYRDSIEDYISDLRDLQTEYEMLMDEQAEELQDLRSDHYALLSNHIETLDDLSTYAQTNIFTGSAAGIILTGIGLLSAQSYASGMGMNVMEFYANIPEIYAEDPGVAALTVGLPAVGLYAFKKSYDAYQTLESSENSKRKMEAKMEEP